MSGAWRDGIPSDQDASGRSFDDLEIEYLTEVIASGTLFGPKGKFVKRLETEFATWAGQSYATACSSGTAAIHAALAALGIAPGDEVLTTGITDIGALTPILYQGGVPVFCDVDPSSGNITAETVAARITPRTRAVIVTHLLGNPADIEGIGAVAAAAGIAVLEDCAQAYGARVFGRHVGSFGQVAAFSLQQGKHITSGEGGLVTTDDPEISRYVRLYVNKAWDYDQPSDHDFVALNYRMTELQAAVAAAQMSRIDDNVDVRKRNAARLLAKLAGVPGVTPVSTVEGGEPSYWRVGLIVDPISVPGGTDALAAELRGVDVPAASRYIKKPAFQTRLFTERNTLGDSSWPFTLASEDALDYSPHRYPGTFQFLSRVLVLPWNERLTDSHVDRIAEAVSTGVEALARRAA